MLASDVASLRTIVTEIERRIARYRDTFGEGTRTDHRLSSE
jgi:hypothetical protein